MTSKSIRAQVVQVLKDTHTETQSTFNDTDTPKLLRYFKAIIESCVKVLEGSEPSPDVVLHGFIKVVNLMKICDTRSEDENFVLSEKMKYSSALDTAAVRHHKKKLLRLIEAAQEAIRSRPHDANADLCLTECIRYKGGAYGDTVTKQNIEDVLIDAETVNLIKSRAIDGNGNSTLISFFPASESDLRSKLFEITTGIASQGGVDATQVFQLLMAEKYEPIWQKISERIWAEDYGQETAQMAMWMTLVSDLTGDANSIKALTSLLMFFLYYRDIEVKREAANTLHKDVQLISNEETSSTSDGSSIDLLKLSPTSRLHTWTHQRGNKINGKQVPPLCAKPTTPQSNGK